MQHTDAHTPLTALHISQGAKMAPFAGWLMPIQYEGIVVEHEHTRRQAGLFDICHMGEFRIEGPGAQTALGKALSHNLTTLKQGKCRYGFLLNPGGGVLDDCIVYHLATDLFMLVVNAACAAGDFAALRERLPSSITLSDISADTAKIDLQGPQSLAALEHILGQNFHDLAYFSFRPASFEGAPLLVSRTGYTGELGYELYLPADKAKTLWTGLLADPRVKPVGLGARDTLRLEAGLPLYGHELDEEHSPAEAGFAVLMTSEADYVGKSGALAVRERLVGLRLEGRRAARNGDSVELPDGRPAGRVTSGSFAPSLGCAVALAFVEANLAENENFVVKTAKSALTAVRTSLPFYTQGTARIKLSQ